MGKCKVCGKELSYKTDKCGECAKKSLQKIFAENPELKAAFKESIEEIKKPENMKKMVDETCNFIEKLKQLRTMSVQDRKKIIAVYQREPAQQVDCNECCYISMTEDFQRINRLNGNPHICNFYRKRVFHNSQMKSAEILYPCSECRNDLFKNLSK